MPHTLLNTLRNLRGNARAAVITEPLFGIPFNLYSPYVSIYMISIGLSESQVGLVASVSLAGQIFVALLSGVITDKLGRKRATLIFDLLAWTIPCLLWATAQNIVWFLIAGLVNSLRRIPDVSWTCILVEDADPADLAHIYAWVYIAGQLSVFFAPIAGILITHFSLTPTVRGLYLLACVMLTSKFFIMNRMVTETGQGMTRMEETRERSILQLLGEYRGIAKRILVTPPTLCTIALMTIMSIISTIQGSFWAILATKKLLIQEGWLAGFPIARSLIMMLVLFFAIPRMRGIRFGKPMMFAFAGLFLSLILLVNTPVHGYLTLLASVLIESACFAILSNQLERLTVINVDAQERARIVSLAYVFVIACTTPFGWIAGILSERNRLAPFILNLGFAMVGIVFVYLLHLTGADRSEAALNE